MSHASSTAPARSTNAAPGPFVRDALPTRVVFGSGSSSALAQELERLGSRRVLVLATEDESGLAHALTDPLGAGRVAVHTGVLPHVPHQAVLVATDIARTARADTVLAVGGGSTTGLGKAVALTLPVSLVAVPTTYAGSEATPIWGTTQDERKETGRDVRVLPRLVIYDPELTFSLPASVTGRSGMNALAHCAEALWSPGVDPLTVLIAEEGLRALARGLPPAVSTPSDRTARTWCLYGAWLAGTALGSSGAGLHHKICHVLGGTFGLPHAETHSVVLPYVAAYLRPAAPEALRRVARTIAPTDTTTDAELLLAALAQRLGSPSSLAALGMPVDGLELAAQLVVDARPPSPRPLDQPWLLALLRDAFSGGAARRDPLHR